MLDLDELQRLAEGAKACVPPGTQWFHVGDLQRMLNAHLHEAEFVHAMSPDTAKKLIAVARAGLVAHREIQRFKMRWMNLPPFAEKLNKTTREGMTMAHQPIMMAEEELRAALEELRSLPDPSATPQGER